MKTLFKDTLHKLEIAILDEYGDFTSGLTVLYDIRKASDNSLVVSGTTSEINNLYTFSYTFTNIDEYRLKYITPSEYENGFEQIYVVDNYIDTINGVDSGLTLHRQETELKIKYILGLEQSNFRITDQVYNSNSQLLSSTIKLFDNATDTNNDTNSIKTYHMNASYDNNGLLTSYKVIE